MVTYNIWVSGHRQGAAWLPQGPDFHTAIDNAQTLTEFWQIVELRQRLDRDILERVIWRVDQNYLPSQIEHCRLHPLPSDPPELHHVTRRPRR